MANAAQLKVGNIVVYKRKELGVVDASFGPKISEEALLAGVITNAREDTASTSVTVALKQNYQRATMVIQNKDSVQNLAIDFSRDPVFVAGVVTAGILLQPLQSLFYDKGSCPVNEVRIVADGGTPRYRIEEGQ